MNWTLTDDHVYYDHLARGESSVELVAMKHYINSFTETTTCTVLVSESIQNTLDTKDY